MSRIANPQIMLPGESFQRPVLGTAEATAAGLRPLTSPCEQTEHWIASNVIRDMERGHIKCAIVREHSGIAVWRSNSGMDAYAD